MNNRPNASNDPRNAAPNTDSGADSSKFVKNPLADLLGAEPLPGSQAGADEEKSLPETGEPAYENLPDNLIAELESLRIDLAEQKDKFLRLYAEFDHFRRRSAKEKLDIQKTGTEELMKALLPVLDDMDRARKSLETATDTAALSEGLNLVFQKLAKTLESKGLKAMETLGQSFDPDLQEAITQFPAPDESQKGKVLEEVEKGYFLHEKPIRFAKVITGA